MKVIYAIAILLLLVTCKKQDTKQPDPTPPVVAKVLLTLSRTNGTPGDIIEVRANTRVTDSEVAVVFNSITTKGYKTGDSVYLFVVPIITAGSATVAIPSLKNSNTPGFTVSNYTPIQNVQAVVTEFTTKRNNLIDSLIKVRPGYNLQPSAESIILLNQLKEEWEIQYSGLAPAEKELIAYVLQKNMPDPAAFTFTTNPASYYAKGSGMQVDVGDKLVAVAKVFVTTTVLSIATIPVVVSSAALFRFFPTPWTGALFLASWTSYVILKEVSAVKGAEVANLKGVMRSILGADVQRNTTTEFTNNSEKNLSMSVSFENLASSDAGIQGDITNSFNKEDEFIREESGLIGYYNKVRLIFSKLKGAYTATTKKIGFASPKSMMIDLDGVDIKVKGVSDNRISYTTSITGTTKKIKVTSNSSADIDFMLQVAYERTLDGREFTRDIPCTFKATEPASVSIVSGNSQSAVGNATLANPLIVVVKDINGNTMQGVSVTWTITAGGGQFTTANAISGANGQALANWKLGASGAQSVSVSVKKSNGTNVTGSPLTFIASVTPVYKLEYVSGGGQTYGGGGMPFPMVFKIRNIATNTYVTSLTANNITLTASAGVGYLEGTFHTNPNNNCGSCFEGYYYVPPLHLPPAAPLPPYTLQITITLSNNGTVADTYMLQQNIQ